MISKPSFLSRERRFFYWFWATSRYRPEKTKGGDGKRRIKVMRNIAPYIYFDVFKQMQINPKSAEGGQNVNQEETELWAWKD